MGRPVALLDANVLYPARLRDLLIRLDVAGLYQARWSVQILDECFSNLIKDRPDLKVAQLDRTRRLMATALPGAMVIGCRGSIESYDLPDADDRHVLAAAVVARVDFLVTSNLNDFPIGRIPSGLTVVSPDAFVSALIKNDLGVVVDVVTAQAAGLVNPPMTVGQLLNGLAQVGLTESATVLRRAIV